MYITLTLSTNSRYQILLYYYNYEQIVCVDILAIHVLLSFIKEQKPFEYRIQMDTCILSPSAFYKYYEESFNMLS